MEQEQFVVAGVRAEATGQGGAIYRRVTFASGAHGVMRGDRVLMYSDVEADAAEMFDVLIGRSERHTERQHPQKRRRR